MGPVSKPPIVECFERICNDKRNDVVCQALFEHDKAPHSPITVLKRVNALERVVKREDVIGELLRKKSIFLQKKWRIDLICTVIYNEDR